MLITSVLTRLESSLSLSPPTTVTAPTTPLFKLRAALFISLYKALIEENVKFASKSKTNAYQLSSKYEMTFLLLNKLTIFILKITLY